jgi:predicted ATPase
VPDSLRQLIELQLGQLSLNERRVVETASVAGAEFSAAAVAAGLEGGVGQVEEWCEALVQRGQFLRVQGEAWPDGTMAGRYGFRHALHQQVVYERLPVGRRVYLHRCIAVRLEQAYGDQVQTLAVELARHWQQGQDPAQAVRYRRYAAEQAVRRYAYREAVAHLTTALDLLAPLSKTPARVQEELSLHLALGVALLTLQGHAAPEVERTYTRALALCQRLGETAAHFPVLRGLWNCAITQGKLRRSRERGEQLLALAQRRGEPALLPLAHRALGTSLYWLGEFVPARQHLEPGWTLATAHVSPGYIAQYGEAPGLVCQLYGVLTLWLLGYPDQAGQLMQEALRRAETLAHPFSLGFALIHAAWLHRHRREAPQAQERAEAAMALAARHELAQWLALGTVLRGWAITMQDQGVTGLVQLQEGLGAFRATGAGAGRIHPVLLALQAEAAALAGVTTVGERHSEAELYRLKGELLLQAAAQPHSAAETCFHQALESARRQHAKSHELRAATSLSRLWQYQGQTATARGLLAEVYGWFTEGFETPDLQDAQALLYSLGASPGP